LRRSRYWRRRSKTPGHRRKACHLGCRCRRDWRKASWHGTKGSSIWCWFHRRGARRRVYRRPARLHRSICRRRRSKTPRYRRKPSHLGCRYRRDRRKASRHGAKGSSIWCWRHRRGARRGVYRRPARLHRSICRRRGSKTPGHRRKSSHLGCRCRRDRGKASRHGAKGSSIWCWCHRRGARRRVYRRPARLHRCKCRWRCRGNFCPTPAAKNRRLVQCRTALTAKLSHCLSPSRSKSISLVHFPADAAYSRVNSTRRLRARPSSVSLVSMGCDAPNPFVDRRSAAMWYCVTSACFTAAARRFERSRL
jgi:hypothetical protein